jgi:hypothetical protein
MTYEQFTTILDNYKSYSETISGAEDVGLDLYEGKFATVVQIEKILETVFLSHYTEEGWEWIDWFIYENEYGQRGMEAYDEEKNAICYSYKSLYNYINKHHKLKE